jgi:ppGpp synthetase/RelA/SpoT-type nucleotidyltranferase
LSLLPKSTLDFYAQYQVELADYEDAADEAKDFVAAALEGSSARLQSIAARAKRPHSLLDKLRRKEYSDPVGSVRDLIGVRVITHYDDDAEKVAAILRPKFEVDDSESGDRLVDLDYDSFGYRSIHLVVRLWENEASMAPALGGRWFEIQVRSLLQHAWASIEHEVRYKAGIEFPEPLSRRLASVAGGLENLEYSFLGIRGEQQQLIDDYRAKYEADTDSSASFDAARLTACLEVIQPAGSTLRNTTIAGQGIHIAKLLKDALAMVGITTRDQLETALGRGEVHELLEDHASALGVTTSDLSHAVLCLVVVWSENEDVLLHQFPELRFDPELEDTLGLAT